MTHDELRDQLKAHMAAREISVAELSRTSGYTRAKLQDWLSGVKSDINLSTAARVFDAAGLSLNVKASRKA